VDHTQYDGHLTKGYWYAGTMGTSTVFDSIYAIHVVGGKPKIREEGAEEGGFDFG